MDRDRQKPRGWVTAWMARVSFSSWNLSQAGTFSLSHIALWIYILYKYTYKPLIYICIKEKGKIRTSTGSTLRLHFESSVGKSKQRTPERKIEANKMQKWKDKSFGRMENKSNEWTQWGKLETSVYTGFDFDLDLQQPRTLFSLFTQSAECTAATAMAVGRKNNWKSRKLAQQ